MKFSSYDNTDRQFLNQLSNYVLELLDNNSDIKFYDNLRLIQEMYFIIEQHIEQLFIKNIDNKIDKITDILINIFLKLFDLSNSIHIKEYKNINKEQYNIVHTTILQLQNTYNILINLYYKYEQLIDKTNHPKNILLKTNLSINLPYENNLFIIKLNKYLDNTYYNTHSMITRSKLLLLATSNNNNNNNSNNNNNKNKNNNNNNNNNKNNNKNNIVSKSKNYLSSNSQPRHNMITRSKAKSNK